MKAASPFRFGGGLPAELAAALEVQTGMSLADVPPEVLAFAVEKSKKAGNDAFVAGTGIRIFYVRVFESGLGFRVLGFRV
jgi:hypothetical protein